MTNNTSTNRIVIIDALRGFALAGIVIVHLLENYLGVPPPEDKVAALRVGTIDYVVDGFNFLFLVGKFFALFAFLFGLSFYIQMDRADSRGENFTWRFLWRLILLFFIGYLHHLFYRGDILTIYAFIGIFLIPFYRVKTKYLLVITGMIFLGLGRYLVFALNGGDNLFSPGQFTLTSPIFVEIFDMSKHGTLAEVFRFNALQGFIMKMDVQLGVFMRGYLTFAFFLLGLLAGRMKFFHNILTKKEITKNLMWLSLGVYVVSLGLVGVLFSSIGPNFSFDNWKVMFALTAMDLANIGMTGIIVSGFILLYRKVRFGKILSRFAPYGRMALTNYFMQGVIGTFIMYGWGLGYLAELRNIYTFLMALVLIAIQMWISKWWLSRFYYGPFEWLWRSLTHFKRYPLRRRT